MKIDNLALRVNGKDNVATVFADGISAGDNVCVVEADGSREDILVHNDVPYGHKIALADLSKGELIVKYGETIGMASQDIRKGEHVHVQNLDAIRGRGDSGRDNK